jgi:hypothetical protein
MSTHGGTSTSAPPATTVTGPDTIGHAAVVGTGLHYARTDHDHGLPALDYNAMQYQDLLGWTFDPSSQTATDNWGIPVATAIYLARIPLPAAMTITNVLCHVITLGVTLTHSFLALFKSDGTVIGQTADQSTAWEIGGATGIYTLPLAGGAKVCTPLAANDFLWAGLYMGTAGTGADLAADALGGNTANTGPGTNRWRCGTILQADTATLASISPAGIANNNHLFWFGIS